MSADGHRNSDETFRALIRRFRSGDQEAAHELVRRYGQIILQVVRRRLPLRDRMRAKFDSMDFVQDVWASFLCDPTSLPEFDGVSDLVNYLWAMTNNKVGMERRRRYNTDKWDVRRENPLTDANADSNVQTDRELPDCRQSTPSQIAMERELWGNWMRHLKARDCEILRMRREGASFEEIADRLQINEKTPRRLVDRLRKELDSYEP